MVLRHDLFILTDKRLYNFASGLNDRTSSRKNSDQIILSRFLDIADPANVSVPYESKIKTRGTTNRW